MAVRYRVNAAPLLIFPLILMHYYAPLALWTYLFPVGVEPVPPSCAAVHRLRDARASLAASTPWMFVLCAVDDVFSHTYFFIGGSWAVQAVAGCVVVDAWAAIRFVDLARGDATPDSVCWNVYATWNTPCIWR
eukprot:COSAG02_NODE_210_length_28878_cov_133.787136_30_plen_133_part_00